MTEEEIQRAKELIEKVRPDSWWGSDADNYLRVGDIRLLISFLERAIAEIEETGKREIRKTQCKFDLGEDWG